MPERLADKHRILLWVSLFLIIFGIRLVICNHFAVDAPFSDDWQIIADLNQYRNESILGPLLFKIHSAHIIAFTRIQELLTVKYNGMWEMRIENVFHALVYAVYALVTALILHRALRSRELSIFAAVIAVFGIPWAGDLTLWPLLSCFTWMMLWSIIQVAILSLIDHKYWKATLSLMVCSFASLSMGGGSLAAALSAGWFLWLTIRGHSAGRIFNSAMVVIHIGLFLFYFSLIPGSGSPIPDPATIVKAFLRCLAFPTINVWPIGVLAFAPWLFLAFKTVVSRELPSKERTLLLLLGGLVVAQSLGIAVFRGDNNNGGIPASRYYEILILGPLVNLGILLSWLPPPTRRIWSAEVGTALWGATTLAGFMLMFFWRVTPWVTHDSGEWEQGVKQAALASWTRGDISVLPDYADKKAPEISFHDNPDVNIRKFIALDNAQGSLLPGAMFGGYPLKPADGSDGFKLDGFPNNRNVRPWLRYWGSHDRSGSPDKSRRFESEPFETTSGFLQFEVIMDKKSRFRFYNLGNCSLKLIRVSDGNEIDLLRKLPRSFPSILMDRESICVKLPSVGTYKIVAEDREIDTNWFAFSEPTAAGPLSYLTEPLLNSGKLVIFCGMMVLGTSLFLRRWDSPLAKS